ncbi:hypothetical protein W02_17930 [Nitrospira sp. KM1]|nr:hypothetical protein W02_17930 [Nitrospira sp. KM1]
MDWHISSLSLLLIGEAETGPYLTRYNIVNEADLKAAASRLSGCFSKEMGTITGTIDQLTRQPETVTVSDSAESFTFSQA